LIEPVLKKAAFLKEAARALGLSVKVESRRIEGMEEVVSAAETVTAKGVRIEAAVLQWAHRALKPEGQFVAWMGSMNTDEIQGFRQFSWNSVQLPRSDARFLVFGSKIM